MIGPPDVRQTLQTRRSVATPPSFASPLAGLTVDTMKSSPRPVKSSPRPVKSSSRPVKSSPRPTRTGMASRDSHVFAEVSLLPCWAAEHVRTKRIEEISK